MTSVCSHNKRHTVDAERWTYLIINLNRLEKKSDPLLCSICCIHEQNSCGIFGIHLLCTHIFISIISSDCALSIQLFLGQTWPACPALLGPLLHWNVFVVQHKHFKHSIVSHSSVQLQPIASQKNKWKAEKYLLKKRKEIQIPIHGELASNKNKPSFSNQKKQKEIKTELRTTKFQSSICKTIQLLVFKGGIHPNKSLVCLKILLTWSKILSINMLRIMW